LVAQQAANAATNVTVCRSGSCSHAALSRQADVVVVANGQARYLNADMVRPAVAVIAVGRNRQPGGKLAGNVDFEAVKEVASATPPGTGGVGPLTIALLHPNTLAAARLQA